MLSKYRAVGQFLRRLAPIIAVKGGHVEHSNEEQDGVYSPPQPTRRSEERREFPQQGPGRIPSRK